MLIPLAYNALQWQPDRAWSPRPLTLNKQPAPPPPLPSARPAAAVVMRAAAAPRAPPSIPAACTERSLALLRECVRASEASADRVVESQSVRQLLLLLTVHGGRVTPAARRHVAEILQVLSASKLGAWGWGTAVLATPRLSAGQQPPARQQHLRQPQQAAFDHRSALVAC